MKRLIALLLAVVCLGCATAYAAVAETAPSVEKDEPVPGIRIYERVIEDEDKVLQRYPYSDLLFTSVGRANTLSEANKKALLDEYDKMKEVKDGAVLYCYFLDFKPGKEVIPGPGEELRIILDVRGVKEGDNIVVRLNGEELPANKVEAGNGTVTVRVQNLGVFSIIRK